MNKRIKEFAEQAGFVFANDGQTIDWSSNYDAELDKFAELICADEREACARVCERLTQHALGISNIDLRNAAWFIRNGRTK